MRPVFDVSLRAGSIPRVPANYPLCSADPARPATAPGLRAPHRAARGLTQHRPRATDHRLARPPLRARRPSFASIGKNSLSCADCRQRAIFNINLLYVCVYVIYRLLVAGSTGGTGVRRRRKSGFLERLLPAARDRAVPPSGWRGELTLVTRHGLGAPGFVEVPSAHRHEVGSGLPGTSWLRVWRHAC